MIPDCSCCVQNTTDFGLTCTGCRNGKIISDDNKTCVSPPAPSSSNTAVIVAAAVGVGAVAGTEVAVVFVLVLVLVVVVVVAVVVAQLLRPPSLYFY